MTRMDRSRNEELVRQKRLAMEGTRRAHRWTVWLGHVEPMSGERWTETVCEAEVEGRRDRG